ncbi:MAG TPA: B12-binding domain-containing radical SAM protein [Lachnospiraceae bacterium]|nr:B12-binding domain-containing radical SAM protein [Lachnospiraceae bacterium]
MNILLIAINAKFIHSSLAVRSLKAYCPELSNNINSIEYTINNSEDYILTDIFKQKPDVICFSCYIWNINMIVSLSKNLKKILPNSKIVCGGPEVSYESEDFILNNSNIDIIIRGEGEKTFSQLCHALIENAPLDTINGLTLRTGDAIVSTQPQLPISMDELPFVYSDFIDLQHRIIYYETQRGCPYNCQFCLSSVEKGVRFLSLEKVFTHLDFFLKNKVRQVKFVDRTFNCNKKHATAIWQYLIANDNGVTNFHMEIEAHIMEDDTINLLSHAREGLFQFEIGIQSTNCDTLTAVKRNPDFDSLKNKIEKIKALKNIHVHLDLIAGLPYESYSSFRTSFNDVYSLNADQLQLGFLKVLKGSGLRADAEKYGIVNRHQSPYEVLFTNDISFEQMVSLKAIEDIVETYYNSGKALHTAKYTAMLFDTPFDFYELFSLYWENKNHHRVNHSKQELYTIFYEFCLENNFTKSKIEIIKELLKFDMLLCDNLNSCPSWVNINTSDTFKHAKRQFFNTPENIEKYLSKLSNFTPAQLSRMCRIESFSCNPLDVESSEETVTILFNYYSRDFISNQAFTSRIEV